MSASLNPEEQLSLTLVGEWTKRAKRQPLGRAGTAAWYRSKLLQRLGDEKFRWLEQLAPGGTTTGVSEDEMPARAGASPSWSRSCTRAERPAALLTGVRSASRAPGPWPQLTLIGS